MRTVLHFIWHLKLGKSDEEVLIKHVEHSQEQLSGPGLGDKCTNTVRHFLKANPPPRGPKGMSWDAFVKLDKALDQGFTSKQAYKMAIPAIGIVAVLVANVTFVAWVTPPGGADPPWLGCNYPLFTAFLILNGVAFVLAVASTVVVTAFPLVLSKTPHQAVSWGGILLVASMLSFIAAFLLAGYVTVGYKAPPPSCSNLLCTEAGIACKSVIVPWMSDSSPVSDFAVNNSEVTSTVFGLDPNVAVLNSISTIQSMAVCLTYNRSISYGSYTTLLPWVPPFSWPAITQGTQEAIARLLEDPLIQLQTVCMDRANMPNAIDPRIDPHTLAVNISGDIPNLASYLNTNQLSVFDVLPHADFEDLWPYSGLLTVCLSHHANTRMPYDVLCEQSWKLVGLSAGNLSVSKTGQYIKAATASDSDAAIFENDVTSQQVSIAVHALVGVFAMICLIITNYLVKSKVNQ